MQDGNEYEKVDATTVAMGKLIMATWIYGKKQTSKLLANYQQHNFKEIPETNDEIYRHNTKSLVYVAKIIISLREDLMNYEAETMDLLKLKINDISTQNNYKFFEQLIQEVEEETK